MRFYFAFLLLVLAAAANTQVDEQYVSGLKWREIGPYRGGRSVAVSGVVGRPAEFYIGFTGGGVWKSTNSGVDWTNVSDGFFQTSSVGAIAVSASNPDVVYVGMGECDIRGNISHGDGVYKSIDGGKTWSNVGLRDTRYIAKIRIHPTNPDIAYVAALGHVYGPHPDRGVFKTTDGGKTWKKVLFVDDRSGAISITMDSADPNTLFAATWEAWRTPYSLNSGGPGSRIFKSLDGGATWKDISKSPGLPAGTIGKVGIAISPADSKRVYAIIEALDGGIFSSDDGGGSWTKVSESRQWRQRAWYYTHVVPDTKDRNTVYVLNVGFGKSTDGGKTFSNVGEPHSDNHDLWIDPSEPLRMINANDGGGNVSQDGGRTWTDQDFATAQFYHVTTDNAFPYRIYGAQQDNSTVRIASRTNTSGIGEDDWTSTAGGESGYIAVKPDDADVVFGGSYGGYLEMRNHRTNQSRNVNPWPDNPMGHGAEDSQHRMQWTFPIVFSPHDPNLLYTCSQHVLATTNGGQSWKKISPDLTRNDPATLGPSGGPITKDNTSVEYYGTVFTLAESPAARGTLYAGSDDGLVHVTQDGGGTWKNVTPAGMPKWGLCSMIEASRFDAGTAYLAVDNHENDDHLPYIFITRDFGTTWTKSVTGIADTSFVRVVREDTVDPNLLFAGTEDGVYVSFDKGAHWQSLRNNLPVVPIHDLAVKENDLVAATHGRSFWVLDDYAPLREVTKLQGGAHLFKPLDAMRLRWGSTRQSPGVGVNPPSGVVIDYFLPAGVKELKVEVLDESGTVVATASGAQARAGMNRTTAYPMYPSYRSVPGMIFWAAGPQPLQAPPGEYAIRMSVDGAVQTQAFRWLPDPRSGSSDADLIAQFELLRRVVASVNGANDAVVRVREIKKQLDEVSHADVKADCLRIKESLSGVEGEIYQVRNQSGQDPLNYPIKLNNKLAALIGVVQSGSYRPTDQAYEVFEMLAAELGVVISRLEAILRDDLAALNGRLKGLGLPEIAPAGGRSG